MKRGPQRIVCLTEETTEWLYLLGEEERIVGISGYTVRPRRARAEKPRVSAFLDGKIDQIVALEPDLVVGFSDMQAALADKLIRAGLNVLVTNQRSVAEVLATLRLVAGLIGAADRAEVLIRGWEDRWQEIGLGGEPLAAASARLLRGVGRADDQRDPVGVGLIRMAGGDDVFPELGTQRMGRDRVIADPLEAARRMPDIIVGSWCGKKFRPEKVASRPGLERRACGEPGSPLRDQVVRPSSSPAPAALTDGLEQLHGIFADWSSAHGSP